MDSSEKRRLLILDWTRKIHTLEYAHRYASVTKDRLNLLLGVPAVIISSSIGAQVSAPWHNQQAAQFVVAIGATVVAIMVGLLTFFKPSEVAEKHRSASAAYEDLRHRLEFLLTFDETDDDEIRKRIEQFKAEWDRFQTPNVPDKMWRRAKTRVSELGTYPESLRLDGD
jgi:hypothetical protein